MEIQKILLEKGLSPHLKGFRFICYAIKLVIEDNKILDNATKLLYPAIARVYNETDSNVARAISRSIKNANIQQKSLEFISKTALELLIRGSE